MVGEIGLSRVVAQAVESTLTVAATSPSGAAASALLVYLFLRVRRQVGGLA